MRDEIHIGLFDLWFPPPLIYSSQILYHKKVGASGLFHLKAIAGVAAMKKCKNKLFSNMWNCCIGSVYMCVCMCVLERKRAQESEKVHVCKNTSGENGTAYPVIRDIWDCISCQNCCIFAYCHSFSNIKVSAA